MRIKQVTKPAFEVDDRHEADIIRKCLDYAHHRLSKHRGCGISDVVDAATVERLRRQFAKGLEAWGS